MLLSRIKKQFRCPKSLSLIWIVSVFLPAVDAQAERLPIKTYTVADGLLRDSVKAASLIAKVNQIKAALTATP